MGKMHVFTTFAMAATVSAVRVRDVSQLDLNATVKTESFVGGPGALLDEQYELTELIRTSANDGGNIEGATSMLEQEDEGWPRGFERLQSNYGTDPKRAGEGAFGEVWLAQDVKTRQNVAVKLFKNGRGGYVMCGGVGASQFAQTLGDASSECTLAQTLTDGPEAQNDPVGASRIAKCLKNEVRGKIHNQRSTPCYLVLENGGKPLDKWVDAHRYGKSDPKTGRLIVKQILEAVNFLNKFYPAYLHHDMKPDNTVMTIEHGVPKVKLIDWGCAIQASSQFQMSQVDPEYAPPEYAQSGGRVAYSTPAHSFDMFQVGLMWVELLCPDMHRKSDFHVDMFGRRMPKSTWVRHMPTSADFLAAGCCVDDSRPDQCVTNKDIGKIQMLLGQPMTRPHPRQLLASSMFGSLPDFPKEPRFGLGDLVRYTSKTLGRVLLTQITKVFSDGTYEIDVKPGFHVSAENMEIYEDAGQTPPELQQCPAGSLPFGEKCICDSANGFVLTPAQDGCVKAIKSASLAPSKPDASWCEQYKTHPLLFTHMCKQRTVNTQCWNLCHP